MMSEPAQCREIIPQLNNALPNYNFVFLGKFCDIADETKKVYVEAKPDYFAYSQILYAVAWQASKDPSYKNTKEIGVLNLQTKTLKLYKLPLFETVDKFARSINPDLILSPSQLGYQPKYDKKAEDILNDYVEIIHEDPRQIFLTFNVDEERVRSIFKSEMKKLKEEIERQQDRRIDSKIQLRDDSREVMLVYNKIKLLCGTIGGRVEYSELHRNLNLTSNRLNPIIVNLIDKNHIELKTEPSGKGKSKRWIVWIK